MKSIVFAAAAATLFVSAASAQTANPESAAQSQKPSPGTVGAMGRSSNNGVATNPQAVRQQQGSAGHAAPGTVGAAPGTTPAAQPK